MGIFKSKYKDKNLAEQLAIALKYKDYSFDTQKSESENIATICTEKGVIPVEKALTNMWYKNQLFPAIAKKDDGKQYFLRPTILGRFMYYDQDKHKNVLMTKRVSKKFDNQHVNVFFKPLSPRPIKIKDVLKFAMKTWTILDYLCVFLIAIAIVGVGLFLPKFNDKLFSLALPGEFDNIKLAFGLVVFIISTNLGILLLTAIQSIIISRLSLRTTIELEGAVMMRVASLPNRTFSSYTAGDLAKRIDYLKTTSEALVSSIFVYGLSCLFSLIYFVQISRYSTKLIIPSLIMVSLIAAFSIISIIYQVKTYRKAMSYDVINQGVSLNLISGVQKIKVAGAEERALNVWKETFMEEMKYIYNPPFIVKCQKTILTLLYGISAMVTYAIVAKQGMDAGEYYAFQTSFGLICASFTALATLFKSIGELKPGLELLKPILEIQPENNEHCEPVTNLNGNISLKNISFKYKEDSPYLFKDFSFDIKQGEYVAIVGKTGCGKSTLIKLILGFETPCDGDVYYDGKNIKQLNKRMLRKHIGTVMQNDKLFVGSIRENLTVCKKDLTEEQIWEIADIVDMKEDIEKMPMKLNTLISESGGVSGGQRQRLVIGRAIAGRPSVLILDEATSALDNIAQNKICRSLDKFNCTRIVIAHRLSTIKNCDRIIVIDQGKIIEDGTFDQLIKNNGFFADLVEKQRLDK